MMRGKLLLSSGMVYGSLDLDWIGILELFKNGNLSREQCDAVAIDE